MTSSENDKPAPEAESRNPIKLDGRKGSEDYKYFANDFHQHRLTQWTSIYPQCAPIALPLSTSIGLR